MPAWEGAERVCAQIREAGGEALAFKADVRDAAEIDRMVGEIEAAFGGVDVLVAKRYRTAAISLD